MNLASFLVGMVGPMAARLLASLGLSMVTLVGLTTAFATFKTAIMASIGSMPAATVQLGALLGAWHAIGVWLGGLVFCMTWASTKGFWALAKS